VSTDLLAPAPRPAASSPPGEPTPPPPPSPPAPPALSSPSLVAGLRRTNAPNAEFSRDPTRERAPSEPPSNNPGVIPVPSRAPTLTVTPDPPDPADRADDPRDPSVSLPLPAAGERS
jgi:hypothetical protein